MSRCLYFYLLQKMELETEIVKYTLEKQKCKGEEIGLVFDKHGFLIKIENEGTFAWEKILNLGDKLISISSEKRSYFANIFCLSINNQKWAKYVEGHLKIRLMRMTKKRKNVDTEEEFCAKMTKY